MSKITQLNFRLANFKAFSDTGLLRFAPITVLCGGNSSGKSSILKSILLMKQSSLNRRSSLISGSPIQPLLFNGELVRLGSWTDVVHGKDREKRITVTWELRGELDDAERTLRPPVAVPSKPLFRARHDRFFGSFHFDISITLRSQGSDPVEFATKIERVELNDRLGDVRIDLVETETDSYQAQISNFPAFVSARPYVQAARPFLEAEAFYELYKALRELPPFSIETGSLGIEFTGPFPSNAYLLSFRDWIPAWRKILLELQKFRSGKKGQPPKYIQNLRREVISGHNLSTDDLPRAEQFEKFPLLTSITRLIVRELYFRLSLVSEILSEFWGNIRYLGPLREEPKRFYQFDDTGGIDIGVSGEFSVQVLALERDRAISSSRILDQPNGRISISAETTSHLHNEVNFWLRLMGLPTVSPRVVAQSLYALNVEPSDHLSLALPDVGFGVSQVLPVIIECLRARPGETVLLEQPEIHLHPKVQSILADFFISRASDGVRFLIESHSEYLIKRFCRRIAENNIENIENLVNIIFVKATPFDESTCIPLEMNEFGEVINWPEGFFDSQEDLYWVNASLERRNSQKRPATRNPNLG